MSVINKMLRDLDSRRTSSAASSQSGESRSGVTKDTVSVKAVRSATSGQGLRRWSLRLLLLGMLLGAGVWWYQEDLGIILDPFELLARRPAVPASIPAPVPAPASASVSAPVQVAEADTRLTATTADAGPVQTESATAQPASEPASEPASPAQAGIRPAPAASGVVDAGPVVRAKGGTEMPQVKPSSVDSAGKVAAKSARPDAVPSQRAQPATERGAVAGRTASAAVMPPAPVQAPSLAAQRQAAVQETLAQAQNLWNSGSRETALELMRDAVAVAERASSTAGAVDGARILAPLVQELARMELAQGQVSQVLEMLMRLEPALADQADIWAVRGNAAQRLGRHQESVHAYLTALNLRPNQPRWMLGAAVSMAAQGQTAAAAELAEKARAAGVVTPEVLTYLRQLGVPLH